MKKDLIYSLPVLLATACSDPAAEEPPSNIPCVLHPQEEVLQPYYNLLTENPQIIEAMGFCERPASIQEIMWKKIQETETNGMPPAAPKPQSYYDLGLGMETKSLPGVSFQDPNQYQKIEMAIDDAEYSAYFPALDKGGRRFLITDQVLERATEMVLLNHTEPVKTIYATKEEAHEIYAAHLAHSLWLEKNRIVPWRILEYDQEQLEELLQPEAWFSSWDEAEDNYAFSYILDYSPRETFSVANESISSFSDQKAALIDIIKTTRPFRHGIAVTYDDEGNNTGEHDPMEIVTPEIMKEEKISRHGCQTMSPYIVALANSLNIPGDTILGYYAAAGHRSALFSFTDQVLSHGDDVYTGYLKNTPSSELMDSHEFWEEHVFAYPKGDELGTHNSLVHTKENERKYPAKSLLRDYCEEGKVSLDEIFKDFASEEEIKALEQKIVEITEGCTFFPENDPDQ